MERFNHLFSGNRFLNSELIYRRANRHYENILVSLVEKIRLNGVDSQLSLRFVELPSEVRGFVLRSPGIRARLDEAIEALRSFGWTERVSKLYLEIESRLGFLYDLPPKSTTISLLGDYGFVLDSLSEPTPYLTAIWKQSDGGKWSEYLDVNYLFMKHMAEFVGSESCVLRAPTKAQSLLCEKALEVLGKLHPTLAQEVVLNVRFLCIIDFAHWKDMDDNEYREIGQSVSSHLVPSSCFFSLYTISSLERMVEALYHEALHKKLSNTLLGFEIINPKYNVDAAPRFLSYWNQDTKWNSNRWEFDRALYAFHVYAHLIPFYHALRRAPFELSTTWCEERYSASVERANALGSWLSSESGDCLGSDGISFVKELKSFLEVIHG